MMNRWLLAACLLLSGSFAVADVPYNPSCAPLHGVEGKDYFDFLNPASKQRLDIVEEYHFTPEIENLQRGLTGYIPDELAFVLRALPNHYRALTAMGRWQLMNPKLPDSLRGRVDTADCYFKRAIEFRPNDGYLYQIYGGYHHQAGKLQDAEKMYAAAESMGDGNAELFYNHGLLKLKMGDIDAAQAYADKAYALGYPLPGLRDLLAKAKAKAKPGEK